MTPIKGKLRPIRDNVLVSDMDFDERISLGGIVLPSDDGKSEGVKPRWGKVWAVGSEQTEVRVGDWILVEHGRWTRGVKVIDENGNEMTVRRVDTKCIMIQSDQRPTDV